MTATASQVQNDAATATGTATASRTEPITTHLQPGVLAPDFTLRVSPGERGETLTLSDLRGHSVVLVFYPYDWSPTCGDQLALYSEIIDEFTQYNAIMLGISVDSHWCHTAYAEHRNLRLRLLADFEPKGEVARAYGVFASDGASDRALFVIDPDGVIRWSYLAPRGVNPGADGIIQALESINQSLDRPTDQTA